MVVVHRLAEVANNAILQGSISDNLIGIRSNEDRRDRVSCIDQMSVQLDWSELARCRFYSLAS